MALESGATALKHSVCRCVEPGCQPPTLAVLPPPGLDTSQGDAWNVATEELCPVVHHLRTELQVNPVPALTEPIFLHREMSSKPTAC